MRKEQSSLTHVGSPPSTQASVTGTVDDLENLMKLLGDFGQYQLLQFVLHSLSGMTAGLHMISLVAVAAVPEHRCFLPGVDDNNTAPWFASSPVSAFDMCFRLDDHNRTVPCTSWVYDRTYYQSSKAIEWNFVCDRRWMGAIAQSCYMIGALTGSLCLGNLADKYGRKIIFCISAVLQVVLGVGVAFIPEFYSFLFIRYLYGIVGSAGSYITGFVLTMELVGPTKRTFCGILFQVQFSAGIMLVAFWGYLITDVTILQVIFGLHGAVLLPHWWLIDESPRWLWGQGRMREAVKIVEHGMRVNGNNVTLEPTPYETSRTSSAIVGEKFTYGVFDLFRTPRLRCRALNTCLNWFANSLGYYGLNLNTGKLSGNPYLILFLVGLVEIPCYFLIVAIMDRTGRRSITSSFMVLGGIACIVAALIPQGTDVGRISCITVVLVGKFLISGSFSVIFNYTSEMFPTVIRNSAMGLGSMSARLSGSLTPLITLLDILDEVLPSMIFASLTITSGLLALILPETLNRPLPQTILEGEMFGQGDTACTKCC